MLKHGPDPKQRRSHATRQRLVDAAVATLVELGLAGATTPRIAERARVSQGALFKHFPAKDGILAAAVESMLRDFVADFVAQMARHVGPDDAAAGKPMPDLVTPACAVLWKIFRLPEMRAVFEVYIAARTDAALASRLAPILERHREAILAQARRLFPQRGDDREFETAIDAIVYSMQGAAVGLFAPKPELEIEHLAFLERLARRELGMDTPREARRPARKGS